MKKEAQHKALADLKSIGRQTWQMKPVTKVVPGKKKAKPLRKEKHKGRQKDAGLFFVSASLVQTRVAWLGPS